MSRITDRLEEFAGVHSRTSEYYRKTYPQESGWGRRIRSQTESKEAKIVIPELAKKVEPRPRPRPRETITPLEMRLMALVYFSLGALVMWLFGC